jgi:hypothetical protein
MGALTIAFDTTIVGALALPWVYLVVHLFFSEGENFIVKALAWVKEKGAQVPAGVLLFAMTYSLGSAVSRIAQDFFNDDDLHFKIGPPLFNPQRFRVGVTEDHLLTRVYCEGEDRGLLRADPKNTLTCTIEDFQDKKYLAGGCKRALRWWERDTDGLPASPPKNEKVDLLAHKCGNALPNEHTYDAAGSKEGKQGQTDSGGHDRAVSLEQAEARDDQFIKVAKDILGLQENALMAIGGDYTARLRQLHDQVMVLRGAAFNGVIGFFLCVFMWSATLRNGGPVSRLGWMALGVVPITLIVLTKIAAHHHFYDREPADPPYMEFTLLLLGIVGAAIWWRPLPKRKNDKESKAHQSEAVEPKPGQPKSSRPKTEVPQTNQATTHEVTADMATIGKALADQNQHHQTHDHEMAANKNAPTEHEEEPKDSWPAADRWLGLVVLSLVLTVAAVLGWWSTEVLYAEQVIYSYDSQFADTLGTTAPKK